MNSKNAYAFGFALIGAGVGGFLGAGKDDILVYVGMGLCFGCFVGYFFAGLKGAKSVLLQQDFQKLGDLRGLTIDEIVASVGAYQSFKQCTITDRDNEQGKQYTWVQDRYSITLLFGADGKCIGVSSETSL